MYGIVCILLVLPISAIDKAPTYATGQLISQKNPVQRISVQFVNKKTSKMRPLGQKKLIISFSGQFFQKIMRQGGFIFYFLLLQIRMRVFIFFLPRCDTAYFFICLWMSIYI